MSEAITCRVPIHMADVALSEDTGACVGCLLKPDSLSLVRLCIDHGDLPKSYLLPKWPPFLCTTHTLALYTRKTPKFTTAHHKSTATYCLISSTLLPHLWSCTPSRRSCAQTHPHLAAHCRTLRFHAVDCQWEKHLTLSARAHCWPGQTLCAQIASPSKCLP